MQPVLNFYFYLLFIILGYRATSHPCHATCVKILFLFLFFLGYRSTSLYAMQPWLDWQYYVMILIIINNIILWFLSLLYIIIIITIHIHTEWYEYEC